jgi:hypothetical protein
MDTQTLNDVLAALDWLGTSAGNLPEEQDKAVQMRLTLLAAGLYVAEYKFHRECEGQEPYDALVDTIRGEMGWPELQRYLMTVARDIELRQAGPETYPGTL